MGWRSMNVQWSLLAVLASLSQHVEALDLVLSGRLHSSQACVSRHWSYIKLNTCAIHACCLRSIRFLEFSKPTMVHRHQLSQHDKLSASSVIRPVLRYQSRKIHRNVILWSWNGVDAGYFFIFRSFFLVHVPTHHPPPYSALLLPIPFTDSYGQGSPDYRLG